MQPFENAFVTYGANRRTFAVVKEQTMLTLPKLEALVQAQGTLGNVIEVLKKGSELDPAATQQVLKELDMVADAVMPPAEAVATTNSDGKTLDQLLEQVCKDMTGLAVRAQSSDYELADQIETIVSAVQAAKELAAASLTVAPTIAPPAPPAEVAAPAAAAVEAPPAEEPRPSEATSATEVAAPAETPATPEVQTPPAEQPAVAAAPAPEAAAPAETPATPAPAPTPATPAPDVVTKAELAATLKAAMLEVTKQVGVQIAEALKPVNELKTALKVGAGAAPIYQPPKDDEDDEPMGAFSSAELMDMSQSPELNDMDYYGNPVKQ